MRDSHTERREAVFNKAKGSYDALKERLFKVKDRLTLANERLDREYEKWKTSRHGNMARTTTTTTTAPKGGAAGSAQARFDSAEEEYNVMNKEFIRLEKAF